MHEPTLAAPIFTVTERADGWAVIRDGEPVVTGLYTRAAAETVVETWPQYDTVQTLVPLTRSERQRAGQAVAFVASVLAGSGQDVTEHLGLAQRLLPEGEDLA